MQTRLFSDAIRIGKGIVGLIFSITLLATLFSSMLAAEIPVTTTADELTDNGNCSLREAIQAANSRAAVDGCPAGDGDDVISIPAGTFTITLPGAGEDNNQGGDFDISGTLQIIGLGPELTIIDGNQLDRLFHVQLGATATISGMSITNGHAPGGVHVVDTDADDGAHGGAILNQGWLAIAHSNLFANQAGHGGNVCGTDPYDSTGDGGDGGKGGAIFNASSMSIADSELRDNYAGDGGRHDGGWEYGGNGGNGGDGGAIFNADSLRVTSVTIQFNRTGSSGGTSAEWAGDGHGGDGGAVANTGYMTVTHGLIDGNSAKSGGGVHNGGMTSLISSTVTANNSWAEGGGWFPPSGSGASSGDGGGIYNFGQFDMSYSTIANNYTADGGDFGGGSHSRGGYSGAGGGLYNGGLFSITESTVSGNWTGDGGNSTWGGRSGNGGGIANTDDLTLDNATIVNNLVGSGGHGAWGDGQNGAGGGIFNADGKTALVHNTIIGSNHIASNANDCAGALSSLDYNLLQNSTDCVLTGAIAQTLIGVDPQILPLGDHGGPTPTNAVGFFSPVIDAGSCTDVNGALIIVDQRGMARPVGSGCDIGAVEVMPPTSFAYLPVVVH